MTATGSDVPETVLSVSGLAVDIPVEAGVLHPVRGVSFELRRGETLALVGESGCGKSMVASALMRLLPEAAVVPAGEVRLHGRELLSLEENEMRALRGGAISLIFQEPATSFDPVLTVGEQIVEMILAHHRVSRGEARCRAVAWLGRAGVPEPERRFGAWPHELSGGLKQRAMIAMALAAEPEVVIADEPTTALDVSVQAQVLALLNDLRRERGLALLLITHDLALLPGVADRIALMYAGEIVETAPASDFLAAPAHPYARALLNALPRGRADAHPLAAIEGSVPAVIGALRGCAFAPRCPLAAEACRREAPARRVRPDGRGVVRCRVMPGAARAASRPACERLKAEALREGGKNEKGASAPLLALSGLTVRTRPCGLVRTALAAAGRSRESVILPDLSLTLKRGRTLALVGESGSGKTTAALALLGLLGDGLEAAGSIVLEGLRTSVSAARSSEFRRRVQVVFQDPFSSLDPRMTVGEILAEPLTALRPELGREARGRRIRELLAETGLPEDAAERLPHEFSGGQRQRIAIARALAPEPEVIVLDEPTSALDVSIQAQILNLLAGLQRARGLTYLLITHNFGVVEYLAHRVAVMSRGRIVEEGAAGAVLAAPAHECTRRLLASVPRLDVPEAR